MRLCRHPAANLPANKAPNAGLRLVVGVVPREKSRLAIRAGSITSDSRADVVELVDTRDLKSLSFGYPGSIPGVRTRAVQDGGFKWKRAPLR